MGNSKPKQQSAAYLPSNSSMRQNNDRERERDKRSKPATLSKEFQTIDFDTVETSVLRKYKRVYKIKTRSKSADREELVQAISRHFLNQTVKEADSVTCFLYAIRHRDSVMRLPLNV
ncbi:hypothetical protein VKS41_001118 [Umbelopsis sp. WA50703]|jgi:hypothetical protein